MTIIPKTLNNANRFGPKNVQLEWSAFIKIKMEFDCGNYPGAIELGLKFLNNFKSVADLKKLVESDLGTLFYLAKSYLKIGETDKAIACLHIVLSQNRFVQSMLIGFPQFVDRSFSALGNLAQEYGEEYVQNIDPRILFSGKKKKTDMTFKHHITSN